MDFYEALDRSAAEFERRLRVVGDDQWGYPTPCEGWTVRDLVNHVVTANVASTAMVRGATREDVIAAFARDHLGDDPLQAFLDSVIEQRAAFSEPGALERTCAHPIGDIPGWQLLGFRVADLLMHAWDLARAIGADEELDADVAELVYTGMAAMGNALDGTGLFGPGASGTVPDDAPVQLKLLDLSGRRP